MKSRWDFGSENPAAPVVDLVLDGLQSPTACVTPTTNKEVTAHSGNPQVGTSTWPLTWVSSFTDIFCFALLYDDHN